MTNHYALFTTNEVIKLGDHQYGGAYGDMHVQEAGLFEFYVRGQRQGRMDYVIEDVQPARGDDMNVFYRNKKTDPFIYLGRAVKFEIIQQHPNIGQHVAVDSMALYKITGVKQEGISVCPWKLPGDSGGGCAKRAALASLGHEWNQVFPQSSMQCFYRWRT